MEHKEAVFQSPEGPILCINNCGFFGSAATMNMCSKCNKEMVLKREQEKLASYSIDNIVHGVCSDVAKETVISGNTVVGVGAVALKTSSSSSSTTLGSSGTSENEAKVIPNRCIKCRKRVGLTGFTCRCGSMFCAMHRYSDEHYCPFDYHREGRDAIARANPVVKSEKLEKI